MNILMVVEKKGTAIDRLAEDIKRELKHFNITILDVHPKRPSPQQLDAYQVFADKSDVILYEYWKTAKMLLDLYPNTKPKILAHYNPYNLMEDTWEEFDAITVPNKSMNKVLKKSHYIPLAINQDFFTYQREYTGQGVLMVSSRIEGKKGILPVAQACQTLGVKMTLVGRISDRNYFNQIMQTGVVEFKENVSEEDLRQAYYDHAVHVCNSIDNFESGCYDDKTEILTDDGWKLFKDLNKTEKVATLNPNTNKLEYHKPYKYIEQDNWKELHTFENQSLDFAVTPNHNMWVAPPTTIGSMTNNTRRLGYKPYQFIRADKLPYNFKIKRTCKWLGNRYKEDDKNWFRFMGIWLAEGSVYRGSKNSCRINISAIKEVERNKIKKLLLDMNIDFQETDNGFRFSENQKKGYKYKFGKYLEQFGHAKNKYIPKEILNAKSVNINEFLKWFSYGDGSYYNGNRIFYTSSKKLADGIQECLIKIGKNAHINIRDRRRQEIIIKGHKAKVNELSYTIYEKSKKLESYVRKSKKYGYKVIHYNGKVYCVEVKNHILLVRRNGKAMFCGNTMPVLEAMATGCPVLSRMVGHVPDINNGENMVINDSSPEDVGKLVEKLDYMLKNRDKMQDIREKAWNSVKGYNTYRRAKMYEKLIYSLKKEPLVSVIIPTYNRIKTISKVVESILLQDWQNKEIIIVDDGSTDGTGEFVKSVQKNLKTPVKYINTQTPDTYNLAYARNLGIIESVGDILVFMDDRYFAEKDMISQFVEKLTDKKWLYGNKGAKKDFIENVSCIYRKNIIDAGMFNQSCPIYGFQSQELRKRFRNQGFKLEYVEKAKVKEIMSTKSKYTKKDQIRRSKDVLWSLGLE